MEIEDIKKRMPALDLTNDVADLFKVLGDSTRTRILTVLGISELCVGDICMCLQMTKSAVSHQLRILRQAHLVKGNKIGKEVYYSLDDDHVNQIFTCAITHVRE